MEHTFKGKVIVTVDNAKVGMYVQRGRSWQFANQDCDKSRKRTIGKIIKLPKRFRDTGCYWVDVMWGNKKIYSYRVGDFQFDLVFSNEKPIINFL